MIANKHVAHHRGMAVLDIDAAALVIGLIALNEVRRDGNAAAVQVYATAAVGLNRVPAHHG